MATNAALKKDLARIDSLEELISEINARDMIPGWEEHDRSLFWPEPKSIFVPAHWQYAEAKAGMRAAGRLIDTRLAERRNFIMRNPIPGNAFATLRTLVCAYQSILPGEKARSHRHASHALRVILEAHGSYSIVNGEKHPMESGDIVLTPGGCWHGHGHDGTEQGFWFDGLDIPLTHLLEPMFVEQHPDGYEKPTATHERSSMRFAWKDTLAALDQAPADEEGYFGTTIDLDAPAMPTITLRVHRWNRGWRSRPYRHTANTIYLIIKGRGRSSIGDKTFDWEFGDTIAAPMWRRIEHQAFDDAVIFSMSDERLMRWAKYYCFAPCESGPS